MSLNHPPHIEQPDEARAASHAAANSLAPRLVLLRSPHANRYSTAEPLRGRPACGGGDYGAGSLAGTHIDPLGDTRLLSSRAVCVAASTDSDVSFLGRGQLARSRLE